LIVDTGWTWDQIGQMELWQALTISEYRYYHPSSDALVAAYLGYKPQRPYAQHELLSEEERLKWAELGVNVSPHGPSLDKLPSIIKERFPFLNKANV